MRQVSGNTFDKSLYTYPIDQGGMGGMTLAESAANIKLVTNDKVGQALGPVSLNAQGQVAASYFQDIPGTNRVNLQGGFSVVTGETINWTITDFDSFKNNTASATLGSISISGNTVTYVAPGSVGNETIVVNGRSISFAVQASQPAKPNITSPAMGATNLTRVYQFTSSAFAYKGTPDTHAASDWQFATDNAFTQIFASYIGDTVNKTVCTPSQMAYNTTYYARVRYKGASGNYGAWSDAVYFTTVVNPIIQTEEAILTTSDKVASSYLGRSICVSADGLRAVIGADGWTGSAGSSQGKAYVFLRTGNAWAQEAALLPSVPVGSDFFGNSVAISADGTRISVGARGANGSRGSVYIFLRTGTTWAQEAILAASDGVSGAQFGQSVYMSSDATRIVVGAYLYFNTFTNQGKVYVFSRSGVTWTQEAGIIPNDPSNNAQFGVSVSMSTGGARILVGAQGFTGTQDRQGKAYVFSRSGTTWTQEAALIASDPAATARFGRNVSMAAGGTRLIVGAFTFTDTLTQQGKAYIYSRNGVNWTQEAAIVPPDPVASAQFGYSVGMSSDGTRVAIGAPAYTGTLTTQGKVYVYVRGDNNSWNLQSTMIASNTAAGDAFGEGIYFTDDDSRIVVGAPGADPSGVGSAGAAYVYR